MIKERERDYSFHTLKHDMNKLCSARDEKMGRMSVTICC